MDAKQFAKLFGGFSTEKRVTIVTALIDAGPEGINIIELSRVAELPVIDMGNTLEALVMMDLVKIAIRGENKILTMNFSLLDTLFSEAYDEFGPGRKNKHAEPAELLPAPGGSGDQ